MKSLLTLTVLAYASYQLITYLIIKVRFSKLPYTDGIIKKSKIRHQTDVNGKKIFEADIEFNYTVNGKEYTSEKAVLRSFQLFPNFEYESSLADQYSEGDKIMVKYEHHAPEKGYIVIAPLSIKSTLALIFAMIFVSIIFIIGLYGS